MPETGYRTCYRCKKKLPICRFYNGSASPQRNRVYCDACTVVIEREQAVAREKKRKQQREHAKKRYHENIEKYRERNRIGRLRNLEQRKRQEKIYYYRKKKKLAYQREYGREYPGRKEQDDPMYNFYQRISCGLWGALKKRGFTKDNVITTEVLGVSPQIAWEHLLVTYRVNYGEEWLGQPYHIDHIVPLSTARRKKDVLRLYHYSNLQMLSPEDNKNKGDSLRWKSPYQKMLDKA